MHTRLINTSLRLSTTNTANSILNRSNIIPQSLSLLLTNNTISNNISNASTNINNNTNTTNSIYSTTSIRSFAILDKIKEKMYNTLDTRRESQKEQKFIEFISDLASTSNYNLNSYYLFMKQSAADAGVTGWKSKIPGLSNQGGVEEMKKSLLLLESIPESARINPDTIDRELKLTIAATAKSSVTDINFLLKQYNTNKMLWYWVRDRQSRNLPQPVSQDELLLLMAQSRPKAQPGMQQYQHKPRRR